MDADFRAIAECLKTYKQFSGRFPSTTEGLDPLVHRPAGASTWYQTLDHQIKDPWGHPYRYRIAPEDPKGYDIFSLGPDGVESKDDIHLH